MRRRTLLASTAITATSVTGCLDILDSELDDAPPGISADGIHYEGLVDHLIEHVREDAFEFLLANGGWDAETGDPRERNVRAVRADHDARQGVDIKEEFPDMYEGYDSTFIEKEFVEDTEAHVGWTLADPSITVGEFDHMDAQAPEIEEFEAEDRTFEEFIERAVGGKNGLHEIPHLEGLRAGWPVDWTDADNFSQPEWDESSSRYVAEYTEDDWEGTIRVDHAGYVREFNRYRGGSIEREAVFRFVPQASDIQVDV